MSKWAWGGLGLGFLVVAVSVVLTTMVIVPGSGSSTDLAARALVATVQRRVLSETLTLRGKIEPKNSTTVQISGDGHVTGVLRAEGEALTAGDIPVEVDGRPVLLFEAPFPPWRDITVGTEGPDVKAIESGLGAETDGIWEAKDIARLRDVLETANYELSSSRRDTRAVRRAKQRVDDAERAVRQASEELAESRTARDTQVDWARRRLEQVQEHLARARDGAAPAPAAVRRLERAKTRARQSLAEAKAVTVTAEQEALAESKRRAQRARAALERARRDAMPVLPSSQYAFAESLPARLAEVPSIGDAVDAATLRLASSAQAFTARTSAAAVRSLAQGDTALVDAGGWSTEATVTAISARAGEAAAVRMTLANQPPRSSRGRSATARVTVRSTGHEVLAVPVAGVWTDASGATYVTPIGRDGASGRVRVEVGRTIGGWVELVEPGELEAGDRVRTGVRLDESGSAGE